MRPRSTILRVLLAFTASACFASARTLAAQQLRGTVFFADSATPARGVLVVATDSASAVVGRTVTTSTGFFELALPAEGRYGVRVLRIGYRPHDVAPVLVTRTTPRTLTIVLRTAEITLPVVAVRGERTCRARADSSLAVFRVWEEARKALELADVAARSGRLSTAWFTYRRQLLADSGMVYLEQVANAGGRTPRPFVSGDPDTLARQGYRQPGIGGDTYFGPDGAVLLSNAFLAGHCFRLRPATGAHPHWVGVEFEPTRERDGVVEIAGTAWLDRAVAELRLIEFRYTNLPREITDAAARGRIELVRLPTGEFVVNRWHIALAGAQELRRQVREFGLTHRESRREVTHVNVTGGELQHATVAGLEQYALPGAGVSIRLEGDTGAVAPDGATVLVAGDAGMTAITDSAGVAHLVGLAEGDHLLRITTRSMRAMVARPIERRVRIQPGEHATSLQLLEGEVLAAACGHEVVRRGAGAVTGVLTERGRPARGDTLDIRWTRPPEKDQQLTSVPNDWPGVRVEVDEFGRFKVCNVPRPSLVSIRHVSDERVTEFRRMLLDRDHWILHLPIEIP